MKSKDTANLNDHFSTSTLPCTGTSDYYKFISCNISRAETCELFISFSIQPGVLLSACKQSSEKYCMLTLRSHQMKLIEYYWNWKEIHELGMASRKE